MLLSCWSKHLAELVVRQAGLFENRFEEPSMQVTPVHGYRGPRASHGMIKIKMAPALVLFLETGLLPPPVAA